MVKVRRELDKDKLQEIIEDWLRDNDKGSDVLYWNVADNGEFLGVVYE